MWRWSLIAIVVLAVGILVWPRPVPPITDRALPEGLQGRSKMTIVAFGTSLTARNTWPEGLVTELQACLGTPVRLEREAGIGQGSSWALERLDAVIGRDPDLVLIEFAINDADILDGVSLRRSIAQHDRLLSELRMRAPEAVPLLMTMNPATGPRGLKRPRLHAYYAAYADLAETHNTGLADFYPRWRRQNDMTKWSRDGLHPTDVASDRVILPVLRDMIGAALGATCS